MNPRLGKAGWGCSASLDPDTGRSNMRVKPRCIGGVEDGFAARFYDVEIGLDGVENDRLFDLDIASPRGFKIDLGKPGVFPRLAAVKKVF